MASTCSWKILFKCLVRVFLLALLPFMAAAAVVDIDMLRDPTAPLNMLSKEELSSGESGAEALDQFMKSFSLGSILVRGSYRTAVINEQRVKEGDSIGIAVVRGIDKDGVTLEIGGELKVLSLYGDSIKSLASGETE